MPDPQSPPGTSHPNTRRFPRVLAIGSGLILLSALLLLLRPSTPIDQPRIIQELESFQNRIHSGFQHLVKQTRSTQANDTNSPDLVFTKTDPGDTSSPSFQQEWLWTLPSSALPANDLQAFSNSVLKGWEIPTAYPNRGKGGGESNFHLSFGDSRTHASVLMTAFEKNEMTTIHCQSFGVIQSTNEEPSGTPEENPIPPSSTSLEQFRNIFTKRLKNRCTLFNADSTLTARQRDRYRFDRGGSGSSGSSTREQSWRWVVPQQVLETDGLRAFAEDVGTTWNSAMPSAAGQDYSFSLSFNSTAGRAFVNIIAIPGKKSGPGGYAETVIHYHQLLIKNETGVEQLAKDPPTNSTPLDLEALARIPGSTDRERAANAQLDGDGRMLKSLRERNEIYTGTWEIEYNLRFTTPVPDAAIKSFASSHGMTSKASSPARPQQTPTTQYLRFFKILEFSEATINETTAAVRKFSTDHGGNYIGWNFSSDKIRKRDGS